MTDNPRMLRVGLTGGIACGKTHVLRGLARAGIATLDLDVVAHEALRRGSVAYAAVVEAFGPGTLDPAGEIDRHTLGARVFGDGIARAQLNATVHPQIREEEERYARELAARSQVMVTDGALIIESGGHLRFDRLIVAHCTQAEQIERLMRRDGLSRVAAQERIAAQMAPEEKRRFANHEIDTGRGSGATDASVQQLAEELLALARVEPQRAAVSVKQALGCLAQGPRRGGGELRPREMLRMAAAAGALELTELARSMGSRPGVPWYEAARASAECGEEEPARLSVVAVLWVLGRRGVDREAAISTAASLARLAHRSSDAIAGACLVADALVEVGQKGTAARDGSAAGGWRAVARRWGSAAPPRSVAAAVEAAARWPRDLSAARAECRRLSGDVEICGQLVGLAVGAPAGEAEDKELADTCRRLGFVG